VINKGIIMPEKYPELEKYEIERMENLINVLKNNTKTFFPLSAIDNDIDLCNGELEDFALLHPIPYELVTYLKQYNGFFYNDKIIYYANLIIQENNVQENKINEIAYMNVELLLKNNYFNNDGMTYNNYLCVGHSKHEYYFYCGINETWEIWDKISKRIITQYDSFYALFAMEMDVNK
jgi:hypothetical protein